ncbi:MAG: hypothetical protein ACTSQJ_11055 [Promethearchaeota archaeon]
MYDIDFTIPFELGLNIETIALILNIGIPIIYFANFVFLVAKLHGMDKDAPFYAFIKSLVFFFFFYGLGAVFLLWYDFFYMDFKCPNPIYIWWNIEPVPPIMVLHLWKIGILLTNIGLLLMLFELRKKIFKKKIFIWLPIIWELIGISLILSIGFISIPMIIETPAQAFFWAEIFFLFSFTWSISLPLTYSYVWKNAAGKMKKYAFILFLCFINYGIAWGFRTRFAVWMAIAIISTLPPPFNILASYEFIWAVRAGLIILNLSLVLYAYRKLLKEF